MEIPAAEEQVESHLVRLTDVELPFRKIISYLNTVELIQLAATNKYMKNIILRDSHLLRTINNIGCFNLDLFSNIPLTKSNIDSVHTVLPSLRHIKANVTFVMNNFFYNIRKFNNLEKLSLFIHDCDHRCDLGFINARSLTIRSRLSIVGVDFLADILESVNGVQKLSIYTATITERTVHSIITKRLTKLKLHDTFIRQCYPIIRYILENTQLTTVKLTTEKDHGAAGIMIASDIITRLEHHRLELTEFAFTVDSICKIPYENLARLTKLRKLQICFSVQANRFNLDKIISVVESLTHIQVTFIEYFDAWSCNNHTLFENYRNLSNQYMNTIRGIGNHVTLRKLDFDTIPYVVFTIANN